MAEAATATKTHDNKPDADIKVEVKAQPKPAESLRDVWFTSAEYRQNVWFATPARGTTVQDLLRREFWANVAQQVRVPDKIIVMLEDKSLYAELVVVGNAPTSLDVRLFGEPLYTEAHNLPKAIDDYEVFDGGLNTMWCIRRVSDGRVVKGDGSLKTRMAAEIWLRDTLRVQGGGSRVLA